MFEAFASINVPAYKSFQAHNSFNNRKTKWEKKDLAFGQRRFISFKISKSFFPIPLFSTQILTTFPTTPTHNPTCVGHFVSLHIIRSWPEHPPGRVLERWWNCTTQRLVWSQQLGVVSFFLCLRCRNGVTLVWGKNRNRVLPR